MEKITLVLTVDQVNLLVEGLGKLPLEKSFNLFTELQKQATEQLKPVENGN